MRKIKVNLVAFSKWILNVDIYFDKIQKENLSITIYLKKTTLLSPMLSYTLY